MSLPVDELHVKEKISEYDYDIKLIQCSPVACKIGASAFVAGSILTPLILKRLRFLKTTFIVRVAAGLFAGIPSGYFAAKETRDRCMCSVKNNYQIE